jgi:hypothetical protein
MADIGSSRRSTHHGRRGRRLARRFSWLALALAGLAVACSGNRGAEIRVPSEPPLPRFESAPVKSDAASVWVPGFWDWSEREATWHWVAGSWQVPPRPGAVWMPPSHVRQGSGWALTRGGWQ